MVGKVSEDNAMFPALQRFFEAAGCRTQTDLAKFLDISQSSISDAKRREVIPAEWLLKLLRNRGVNPDWILTGEGVHYLRSAEPGESAFPAERVIEIRPPEQCSAQELINELVRRRWGNGWDAKHRDVLLNHLLVIPAGFYRSGMSAVAWPPATTCPRRCRMPPLLQQKP